MASRLVMIAIFLALLCACSGDNQDTRGAVSAPVRVAKVTREDISRDLTAVGNVRASASVALVPRVGGEILAVKFTEGQDVRAGQPLIQIDPRPYEGALREKRGALAKSQAQLTKALEDRKRFARLVDGGYVSREAFEQTATDAAALRATVEVDKAAVDNAALDLGYCTVTAPISGRIGALLLDRGNMVKTNSSEPIANIDTISPCYVTFSVAEAHLPAIMAHMEKGLVTLTATPTGGQPETGVLTLLDNNVDTRTGTIKLRGSFENPDRHLWPGQFVEVRLPLGLVKDALIVPSRAVQAGRDESYVYAIDDKGAAAYKKVKVLFEKDGQSVVEADLAPGQDVVVDGQVRLAPGMPVKIIN